MAFGASDKCAGCSKTVYAAEKVSCIKKSWHRGCLKCTGCGLALAAGDASESNGRPYHSKCHKGSASGVTGYGYGTSNLSSYTDQKSSSHYKSGASSPSPVSKFNGSQKASSPSGTRKWGSSGSAGSNSSNSSSPAPVNSSRWGGGSNGSNGGVVSHSGSASTWQRQEDDAPSRAGVVKCGLSKVTYSADQPSWAHAEREKASGGAYKVGRNTQNKRLW